MSNEYRNVEYMCTICGKKTSRISTMVRPLPGHCPRRPIAFDGKRGPHRWVINRKY